MKAINFVGIVLMTLMIGLIVGVKAEEYGWSRDTVSLLGFGTGLFLPMIVTKLLYTEDKDK